MSWEETKKISQSPILEIGGHTANHIDMGKSYDKTILKTEIDIDKEKIETNIENKINLFAYPFGQSYNINKKNIAYIKNNYECACTIVPGFNNKDTNKYLLFRDSLDVSLSNKFFKAWLLGSYDMLKKIISPLEKNIYEKQS